MAASTRGIILARSTPNNRGRSQMPRGPFTEARGGAEKRLFTALDEGRLSLVKRYYRFHQDVSVNAQLFRTLINGHRSGLYDHKPPSAYDGGTALHVAAWRGHSTVAEFLVEQGANLTIEDAYGRIPSDVASIGRLKRMLAPPRRRRNGRNTEQLPADIGQMIEFVDPGNANQNLPRENLIISRRIAKLHKVVVTKESNNSEHDCVICLCKFKAGDESMRIPTCGHSFCATCIERWLQRHNSCPTCRAQVN